MPKIAGGEANLSGGRRHRRSRMRGGVDMPELAGAEKDLLGGRRHRYRMGGGDKLAGGEKIEGGEIEGGRRRRMRGGDKADDALWGGALASLLEAMENDKPIEGGAEIFGDEAPAAAPEGGYGVPGMKWRSPATREFRRLSRSAPRRKYTKTEGVRYGGRKKSVSKRRKLSKEEKRERAMAREMNLLR
jgi:hypothetical protein